MDKKINVLIVEDDIDSATFLKKIVEKEIDNATIVGITATVLESIKLIRTQQPEIILMDIVLAKGNAFTILDEFPDPNFEVIFISGHEEYMGKALEHYALNFISKPIDSLRLVQIFHKYTKLKQRMFESYRYEMLKEMIFGNCQNFLLHTGKEYLSVNLSDVIRCSSDGNYTVFVLKNNRKILASKPLSYYSDLLERQIFFRTSRFDLINLRHVKSIYKKETIILSNMDKINVSNRNRSKLTVLIKELSL